MCFTTTLCVEAAKKGSWFPISLGRPALLLAARQLDLFRLMKIQSHTYFIWCVFWSWGGEHTFSQRAGPLRLEKKKKKWYRATPLLLRSEMKFPICFTVQHSFKSSTFWPLLNHFRGVWNITCVAAEIIHFLHSFPWLAIVFEKSTKSLILQQFDRNEIRLFLKSEDALYFRLAKINV